MSKSRAPTFRRLPLPAQILIPAVLGLAFAAVLAEIAADSGTELDPRLFALVAVLCAAGNLFEVFAPAHFSFQPNLAIFFGAMLFLPPWAVAALAVVCFVPGWLVHRFPWYMVAFNIANYTLAGMAAVAIVGFDGSLADASPDAGTALALAAAAVVFVLVNHLLIVLIVRMARGRPFRKGIEDMIEGFPMDIALAMTGGCLAALWAATPPLALLAAGPMVLMYRALWVPLLEHKSRTEPKTGLYNSEYLATQLEDALAFAQRTAAQLSVVMIDLDQLRLVNNRHGHLAGDQLIRAVADTVAEAAAAENGIAARFGGDELCMLLPNHTLEEGRIVAEQTRARIERISLPLPEGESLAITVSTGVASYPKHADSAPGLLEAADAAVYDAKLGGRNRVRMALPAAARRAIAVESADLETPPRPALVPAKPATPVELSPQAAVAGDEVQDERPSEEPAPAAAGPAGTSEDEQSTPQVRTRLIGVYVGLLCAGAALVGLLADHSMIAQGPWLFGLLIAATVLLDAVRIDVFERANLSPAAVPELALAYFFGPLGPIAAEAGIALIRAARRNPALKWGFDLGALALAGAAAAVTFDAFEQWTGGVLLVVGALAGLAYYAVNSALLAVVMGLAEHRAPLPVWRERLAWMTPHYLVFGLLAGTLVVAEQGLGLYAIALFGLPVVMLWIAEKQYLDRSRTTVTELRKTNDELAGANVRLQGLLDDNQELLGRMHRSYLSTITSLARTVEAKDPYTSGHTERVAQIAQLLAAELGFEGEQLRAVEVGAIIHDIGKIGVADDILLKTGPLDERETREMRKHPEMSSYIVAELELPAVVKQMVRSHHERFDGEGYPDRLAGEEIPLAARILTVADALDAMTSDRPYRKALPLDVACSEIQEKVGTQFCPHVVSALLKAMTREPEFWASFDTAEEPVASASVA